MTKQERISNGIKTVSSASGAGKTGQRHAVQNKPGPLSYTIHKNKLKMDERRKCKTGSHQIPQGESRQNLFVLGCSNFLLNTCQEARETKAKMNYWDLIKMKSLLHSEGNNQQN